MIENVGAGLAKAECGEVITPTTSQQPTATTRGRQKNALSRTAKAKAKAEALSGNGLEATIEDVRAVVAAGEAVAEQIKTAAVSHLADVYEALPYQIQADVLEEVSGRDPGTFRQQLNLWTNSLRTAGGAGEFLARDSAETLA